jgi:hypothetical protein
MKIAASCRASNPARNTRHSKLWIILRMRGAARDFSGTRRRNLTGGDESSSIREAALEIMSRDLC